MLRGDNTVLTTSLSTDLSMQVPRCFPPASTQFQANMQTPLSEPALLTQIRGWICRPDRPLRNCESASSVVACSKPLPVHHTIRTGKVSRWKLLKGNISEGPGRSGDVNRSSFEDHVKMFIVL